MSGSLSYTGVNTGCPELRRAQREARVTFHTSQVQLPGDLTCHCLLHAQQNPVSIEIMVFLAHGSRVL